MGCRGVHFALSEPEVEILRSLSAEEERAEHLCNAIEAEYFESQRDFIAESDKAWDAMHRALSDGHLSWEGGNYPFNHVVLAGEILCAEDYIVSLKSPEQVKEIAGAIDSITESEFRQRYFAIHQDDYDQPKSEEDFGYTWSNFEDVRMFYRKAAAAKRYVLFTADQ